MSGDFPLYSCGMISEEDNVIPFFERVREALGKTD